MIDLDRQGSAIDWFNARQPGSLLDGLPVAWVLKLTAPHFERLARGYDCVVLDGPPRLDEITRSAAVIADVALLPVQPGPFDFWAVDETLSTLTRADEIRAELGRRPIRRAFVLNRAGRGTRLAAEAEQELRKSGGHFAGVVHQRVAFPDAASRGESVFTTPGALLAATDVQRLWRALKALHVSKPEKTRTRAGRKAKPSGGQGQPGAKADRR